MVGTGTMKLKSSIAGTICPVKIHRVGHTYFSIIENMLTPDQCQDIIDSCPEWVNRDIKEGIYNGWKTERRFRHIGNPTNKYLPLFESVFNEFNMGSYKFNLIDNKYTHFCNMYTEGQEVGWHRDEDESVEDLFDRTPANRLSCSVFLNEGFNGGHFVLEGIDSWKPKTGMCIMFPSAHLHRAGKVTGALKYNYTVWRKGERGA